MVLYSLTKESPSPTGANVRTAFITLKMHLFLLVKGPPLFAWHFPFLTGSCDDGEREREVLGEGGGVEKVV